MAYYLVTGRICGDDEDASITIEADSKDAAIEDFTEQMWASDVNGNYDRQRMEDNGEGVFVNGVFVSDSPITQV